MSDASIYKQSWKLLQLHPLSINISFMLTAFEEEDEESDGNPVRYLLSVSVQMATLP